MPASEVLRYIGNGIANRSVGGFVRGIMPRLCFIYAEEPAPPLRRSALRISTMPDNSCANVSAGLANTANRLQRMAVGSIDVSTNAGGGGVNDENMNANLVPYNALVLGGAIVQSGSYVGDGASPRTITPLGVDPEFVLVMGRTRPNRFLFVTAWTVYAADRRSTDVQSGGFLGIVENAIRGVGVNSFIVGTSLEANAIGETYDWCATRQDTAFTFGRYTGNGVTPRVIPIPGLVGSPIWVMVFGEHGGGITEVRAASAGENQSRTWSNQTPGGATNILALGPGPQFTVGNGTRVNDVIGHNYTWMAFSGASIGSKIPRLRR